MSIGNYTELKSSVLDFAHRSDLSGVIADLITRAEAGINRRLRLLQQEQRTTLTATQGSRFVALPSGFLEAINLQISLGGSLIELVQLSSKLVDVNQVTGNEGIPSLYRIGSQIEFDVAANEAYPLVFHWVKAWNIANDDTNWLLTNWPDLYQDATLAEVAIYTRDAEMLSIYRQLTAEKIDSVMQADSQARAGTLRTVDPALLGGKGFDIYRGF